MRRQPVLYSVIDRNILGEAVPARGYAEAYYWQQHGEPYTKNAQVTDLTMDVGDCADASAQNYPR